MAPSCPPIIDEIHQSGFDIFHDQLLFNGMPILSDVPPNVVLTPYVPTFPKVLLPDTHTTNGVVPAPIPYDGAFLGFDAPVKASRHVASFGKLKDTRFFSIFRFKVWWTTQWVGSCGSDLETETQFLLLDLASKGASEGHLGCAYVLLIPIFEGKFRASLQAGKDDNVDVCVESGSTAVIQSSFRTCVYMHAGSDPFLLAKDAIAAIRAHLGTFKLLEEKTVPDIVDKFGWCTWDAFYLTVHPQGVWSGVKYFVEGGLHPRFLIIDDGWQSITYDKQDITEDAMQLTVAGEQMLCRLSLIQENHKFRNYVSGSMSTYCKDTDQQESSGQEDISEPVQSENDSKARGLGVFIHDLKKEFNLLEDVYVWHALTGYWGGLRPGSPDSFNSMLVQPVLAHGLLTTMEDLAVDKLISNTIGLVPPESIPEFYDALHSYLAKNGISGAKVDVIHVLEMLGEDHGGRMTLSKAYYDALSASMRKHLGGNRIIASMEHCNDFLYLGTEQIALGRVGDDFWCTDPSGDPFWLQGAHMVHCAYNSMWMGPIMHPDWDMFQTKHVCGSFHAASRAICGGPIYVSDTPGQHDFDLLKKLVLPDGTILRCCNYALPTVDCLFNDPLHDGATVLKIWNLNKYGGVVGAFNCQGGGWSREHRTTKAFKQFRVPCSTTVSSTDIQWSESKEPFLKSNTTNEYVVYLSEAGKVLVVKHDQTLPITLHPLTFELYTFCPLLKITASLKFAAIGLLNMFNSGGAVQRITTNLHGYENDCTQEHCCMEIEIRGSGQFAAYASIAPVMCKMLVSKSEGRESGEAVDFTYEGSTGLILMAIPWSGGVVVVRCIF